MFLTGPIESPHLLAACTTCKIDPVYDTTADTTRGYVSRNLQILGQIAPPVPGDAMSRLFEPRTFTQFKGKKEGAIVLDPGQLAPNPFEESSESSDCEDPHDHLLPPNDPWPMVTQPAQHDLDRMRSQIVISLLQGENETSLSPSITNLTARTELERSKKQATETKPRPAQIPHVSHSTVQLAGTSIVYVTCSN